MLTDRNSAGHTRFRHPPAIMGSLFDDKDVESARVSGRLLSVTLLLSNACNLNCLYCYRDAGSLAGTAFSLHQWRDVLLQARDLGAKHVWIPGSGEPLLDPVFFDGRSFPLLELCNSLALSVTFFTNGTLIDRSVASRLRGFDVSVVTKLNSFIPHTQDYLAGKDNVFSDIRRGLGFLLEAGLADQSPSRLGIDTVIVQQNYSEIPDIFRFCRERKIVPYITANLTSGRAASHPVLGVSRNQLRSMFETLLAIDRTEYGYDWFPSPPIVAGQCKKLLHDVVVDSKGDVQICPGIDLRIGNIKDTRLSALLQSSCLFRKVRNMPASLTGACGTCLEKRCVYGCRLEAWAAGDLFGSDPMCWNNATDAKPLNAPS